MFFICLQPFQIDGNISLGPRTIIELGVYLKKIYTEDIPDCKLCMDIVIKVLIYAKFKSCNMWNHLDGSLHNETTEVQNLWDKYSQW